MEQIFIVTLFENTGWGMRFDNYNRFLRSIPTDNIEEAHSIASGHTGIKCSVGDRMRYDTGHRCATITVFNKAQLDGKSVFIERKKNERTVHN
jgi:hypothetical protein